MRFTTYLAVFKRPPVLLLLYIFLSAILMNFSDANSLYGIRWVALQAVELFDSVEERIFYRRHLLQENEGLKKENFELRIENQQLRAVLLENARLRRLLKLKEKYPPSFISARVIGVGTEKGIQTRIIDIGTDRGVHTDMAVVNADGLVGKVISVSEHQAVVEILIDYNSRVSAKLEKSRESGVVGGSGEKYLRLDYIPRNIPVLKGEWVVTSGLSQIYPPNIKIGVVSEIDENQYDLFKTVYVEPAVNFRALEEVFVVADKGAEKISGE